MKSSGFRRTFRSGGGALVFNLLSVPIRAVAMILVARSLGVALFGIYSFALEFSFVVSRFADAGMGIIASRDISRGKEEASKIFGNLLIIKIFLLLVAFLFLFLYVIMCTEDTPTQVTIVILGLANLSFAFMTLLTGVLQAYEKPQIDGFLMFIQTSLFAFLVVVLAYFMPAQSTPIPMALCTAISYILIVVIGIWIISRRYVQPAFCWDSLKIKYLLKEIAHLLFGILAFGLLTRISILMLSALSSEVEVGAFSAAFRLVFTLGMIPTVIAGVFMPHLSRGTLNSRNAYVHTTTIFFKTLLIFSAPIVVGFVLHTTNIIEFIYGPQYAGAIVPFAILALGLVPFFLNFCCKTVLESFGRQKVWTYLIFAGACFCIVVNYLCIPTYGANGAAIAFTGALLFVNSISLLIIRKEIDWKNIIKTVLNVFLSIIAMSGCILLLSNWSWVFALIVGGLSFIMALVLMGEIKIEDVKGTLFSGA